MPLRFPNMPAPRCLVREYQNLRCSHSLGKLLVHSKHVNLVHVEHRTELVITNNFLLVIGILKASKIFNQLRVNITTCRDNSLGVNMFPHLLDDLWSGHGRSTDNCC
jgi:hypothetical protein